MYDLSFDKTLKGFDMIVSIMNEADKKNDLMFREICKEVIKKSYSKLEIHTTLNIGGNIVGVGIGSAIKMAFGQYKKGSFKKSSKKLYNQTIIPAYSDLEKINYFLDTSEFIFVTKLLKIQYKYGLRRTISSVISY